MTLSSNTSEVSPINGIKMLAWLNRQFPFGNDLIKISPHLLKVRMNRQRKTKEQIKEEKPPDIQYLQHIGRLSKAKAV